MAHVRRHVRRLPWTNGQAVAPAGGCSGVRISAGVLHCPRFSSCFFYSVAENGKARVWQKIDENRRPEAVLTQPCERAIKNEDKYLGGEGKTPVATILQGHTYFGTSNNHDITPWAAYFFMGILEVRVGLRLCATA